MINNTKTLSMLEGLGEGRKVCRSMQFKVMCEVKETLPSSSKDLCSSDESP